MPPPDSHVSERPSSSSLSHETTNLGAREDTTTHDIPPPYGERLEALLASVRALLSQGVPVYTAVRIHPSFEMMKVE